MTRTRRLSAFLFCLFLFVCPVLQAVEQKRERTIFGSVEIDHPLIAALLEAPVMERLKYIDQHGTPYYFQSLPAFNRYDHSVGVYALLKQAGAPFEEQVAGLLHDASHTVFSHTGDHLFRPKKKGEAYQDEIHEWYLKKMNVELLLKKYGLTIRDVLAKNPRFKALEQPLPDLCADRIQYLLQTALIFDLMTRTEIRKIRSDLKFVRGRWYFTSVSSSKKLGLLSLHFTEHLYTPSWNQVINTRSARLFKSALQKEILTKEEIHFGRDVPVLGKLLSSKDPELLRLSEACIHPENHVRVVETGPYDEIYFPKFRGVDPLVLQEGHLKRLTAIDATYRQKFNRLNKKLKDGIRLKYGPCNPATTPLKKLKESPF